jgi:hypothetical protein
MFHDNNTTAQTQTSHELHDAELEMVVGGINPQPLPPDHMPRLPSVLEF